MWRYVVTLEMSKEGRTNEGIAYYNKALQMKVDGKTSMVVPFCQIPSSQCSLFASLLQTILAKGMPASFTAKGFSMAPFIKDGDVLTVVPLQGTSPGLGDVVAFLRPETEKLAIHRVVAGKGHFYCIRGDNSFQVDGFIPKTSILGGVKRVERNGKRVYWGLGPERFLIALLTRRGLLSLFFLSIWRIIHPLKERWIRSS